MGNRDADNLRKGGQMEETARDVYFEDEIDLREYALVLIRNWWLIAAATLVAAASALAVSMLLPPTYEATALVPSRARAMSLNSTH